MSLRWSEAQLTDYLERMKERVPGPPDCDQEAPDPGREAKLQGKCERWAKERGYPYLSFRQSRKAKGFLCPGWPDMSLVLPEGRVMFFEFKSAGGRMSEEQKTTRQQFAFLGHMVWVVRSFKAFKEIVAEYALPTLP